MTEIANLVIAVSNKGVDAAKKQIKSLGEQSAATEKQAASLGSALGKVGAALAGGVFFQAVIRNTIESESALAQLNATIKSTGGAAGLTSDEMVAMAQGLQKVTTFGDDAIISMQSQLLTFTKIGKDAVPRATEAILDLATKMGGDLKGAAIQVGKALNDPIKGVAMLGKAGVQFSADQQYMIQALVETGRLAEAQTVILAELETQFGGSAKAARDTFGGAVIALQNAFGDLLEGGGGNLNQAREGVESLTNALSDPAVQQAFGAIVSGIFKVTAAMAEALPVIVNFTESLGEGLARLIYGTNADDLIGQMDTLTVKQAELAAVSMRMGQSGSKERAAAIQLEIDAAQKNVEAILNSRIESELDAAAKKQNTAETKGLATATGELTTIAERDTVAKAASKEASKAKTDALKAEKAATDALLKKQAETVQRMAEEQAFRDQQQQRLGAADPMVGEQQRHAQELEELRLLHAAKLIEENRYLELKRQAETAHDAQMAAMQEENFRRQSYGNELLMASLDQLQQGATDAFVGVLTGATNGQEAVQQLASSILNEAVGALVEMGIAQVKSIIMGQAAQTAATATSVAAGAATAAAWTPAAAAASIASFGGAAASGLAGMAAAIPAMIGLMSFEGGGFTGSGSRSGGMDGKGGFMAMVHPNETITDHTKGQTTGGGVTVNVIESNEKAGTQQASTAPDGTEQIDVFVADIYGDGPRARAMQNAFGLKRSGR